MLLRQWMVVPRDDVAECFPAWLVRICTLCWLSNIDPSRIQPRCWQQAINLRSLLKKSTSLLEVNCIELIRWWLMMMHNLKTDAHCYETTWYSDFEVSFDSAELFSQFQLIVLVYCGFRLSSCSSSFQTKGEKAPIKLLYTTWFATNHCQTKLMFRADFKTIFIEMIQYRFFNFLINTFRFRCLTEFQINGRMLHWRVKVCTKIGM